MKENSEGGIECGFNPFEIGGKRWVGITTEFELTKDRELGKKLKTIIYWADGTKTEYAEDGV